MKYGLWKKLIFSFAVVVFLLLASSAFIINENNKVEKSESTSQLDVLDKPAGITAFTVNDESTNLSYEELISSYAIDKVTCKNGTIATYNKVTNEVSLSNIHMPDYCTMNFRYTIYSKVVSDNPTVKTRTDFSSVFTETNTGTLYKSTESIAGSTPKDVYYFAGNAQNNWVKFGGFYWRIIRTNHDGSVRLLYSGTSPDTTKGYIVESPFNNVLNDPMYVGYMYGTSGTLASNRTNENDSTIKGVIDTWYSNNLSAYTKYLSKEAVYCNDRELESGSTYSVGSGFNYVARGRLFTNKMPSYNCTNSEDTFSGSNTRAKLTYPIGLMSADEVAYAGGKAGSEVSAVWYYLNSNGGSIIGSTWWWLMSPYFWSDDGSGVWSVRGSSSPGHLSYVGVDHSYGVRPVISLKGNLVWKSGDGSSASPYEVEDLPPTLLANDIKEKSITNEDGVYNENGYRYEGTNPNNYIYMTNKSTNEKELWRIIGVFNDGENGEEVIRVRRYYESNSNPNMAYNTNSTNYFPNTTMYNTLSSTYNLTNYSHTVNFKMYLGTSNSHTSLTSSGWYTAERGTTPGKTAADSYNNSVSFIGSVGIMYPSDYGYAAPASDCPRTKLLIGYNGTAACLDNNWLFLKEYKWQWLISPSISDANSAFTVCGSGEVNSTSPYTAGTGYYVKNAWTYSPVMALESGVLVNGSGTKTDPYVISM